MLSESKNKWVEEMEAVVSLAGSKILDGPSRTLLTRQSVLA